MPFRKKIENNTNYNLFSIETNKLPVFKKIKNLNYFKKLIKYFNINGNFSVYKVIKKNPYSEIFFVKTKKQNFILRSVNQKLKNQIENQCEILNNINNNSFIKPLEINKKYSATVNRKCWIIYKWVDGKIFNGDATLLKKILIQSINIQNKFLKNKIKYLQKIKYFPSRWINIWKWIFGKAINQNHFQLQKILKKNLKKKLYSYKIDFLASLKNSKKIKINYEIVHYDLQHANIIVTKNKKIIFLDIEDICLSDIRFAISHSLFKCLRHSIYMKKINITFAKNWIKNDALKIINKKMNNNFIFSDIAVYSQFRVLSDLYNLFFKIIYKGKLELMYDLEKKLQNLMECFEIFKNTNEKQI